MNEGDFVLVHLADDAAVVPLLALLLELKKNQVTRSKALPTFGSTYFALFLGRAREIDVDLAVARIDQRRAVNARVGHAAVAIRCTKVLFCFGDDGRNPLSLFAILGIGCGGRHHQKDK